MLPVGVTRPSGWGVGVRTSGALRRYGPAVDQAVSSGHPLEVHGSWRRPVVWAAIPLVLGAARAMDALGIALPQIRGERGMRLQDLQWVGLAFLLAQAVVLVSAGRVGDRVGRRPVFMTGLAVVVLGSLAVAVAPADGWLVPARIFEGLGAGILVSGSYAIVRDNVSTEMLGRAFGLWAMVAGIGGWLVGPLVYGALTYYASWRWVMVLNATLGLIALVLTPNFIPGGRPLAIVRPSVRRLLRDKNFVVAATTISLIFVIFGMLWLTLIFYFNTVHALSATKIGLLALVYGIPYSALPPFTGRLADRVGVRRPLLIGFGLVVASMVLFSISTGSRDLVGTVVAVTLTGAGVIFVTPALNAVAFRQIHVEDRSDASGIFLTMRLIGTAAGVAIATTMLGSISDTTRPAFGVVAGYDLAASWVGRLGVVVALVAFVVVMAGIRPRGVTWIPAAVGNGSEPTGSA